MFATHRQLTFQTAAVLAIGVMASTPAAAHPPAAQEDDQNQAAYPQVDSGPPMPSLDDLLEIEPDGPGSDTQPDDAAARDRDEELARQLTEQQIADNFTVAIEKMSVSAEMLDVKFDAGLGTQRVQEEIIARLEQLIDQAGKQRMQMSSRSQPQGRDRQQGAMQPQPSQPQQGQADRPSASSDSVERDPPPMQQGDIGTVLEETRTEWGNLPQRVRDMLMQGLRDKRSSLYRELTEEYYKRLAEEDAP